MKVVNEANDARLSTKYEKLLVNSGYKLGAVSDDVLIFREDKEFTFGYTLAFDSKEPRYIAFGLAAAIKGDKQRGDDARYALLQDAMSNIKYVKAHFRQGQDETPESIQFSCEVMIFRDDDFPEIARRAVSILSYAYTTLGEKYSAVL